MKKRLLFMLLLLALLLTSCTPPPDISAPITSEDQINVGDGSLNNATSPEEGTLSYWRSILADTPLAITDPYAQERQAQGLHYVPYFCAEVTAVHEHYVTLKPLPNMDDPRKSIPSCAASLLKHSDTYIVPKILTTYLTLAVGDTVQYIFNYSNVYLTSAYGDVPVIFGGSGLPYTPLPEDRLYFKYWQELSGNPITIPNLLQNGTGIHYFLAEVVATEKEYLIVKPRDDIAYKPTPYPTYASDALISYSAELLGHSERYIVPRSMMGDYYIEPDSITVGDIAYVGFHIDQVYTDTVYHDIPVIRAVHSVRALGEDEMMAAQ
jgi:hypothetical protein